MPHQELTVRRVPVSSLRPYARNPRLIQADRFRSLVKSLAECPEMMDARPLIALSDGRVICGNMRLRAVQELRWDTVQTIKVDLDEATAHQWMLRDNAGYGEWDEPALAEILHELMDQGADLELTGLSPEELGRLLDTVGAGPEPEPETDREPPETCAACGQPLPESRR